MSRDKIDGVFLLLDRLNIKGLQQWSDELYKRGIPAIVSLNKVTLENDCDIVKQLSARGFEICGAYNEGPLWDESYSFQKGIMSQASDNLFKCTGKQLRIFGAKYMSYNEDTLKIADELGINYILARGTAGARAVVYKPAEYKCRLISASNVPSKQMGTGSLCDESLRCRTETPDSFREILFNLTDDRILLVAQTHLSGVKLHWWNVYQEFFNTGKVNWKTLDEFCANPIVLPVAQIPINTRADYIVPKPLIPLEQEADYPFGN